MKLTNINDGICGTPRKDNNSNLVERINMGKASIKKKKGGGHKTVEHLASTSLT